MYETRWPRPGPAMVAVAIILGLAVGGLAGFASAHRPGQARKAASTTTRAGATPTTLPHDFWTVVLSSQTGSGGRQRAESVARQFRARNVDVSVLDPADWSISSGVFAVVSGAFATRADAAQHQAELQSAGVAKSYLKQVSRRA